MSNGKDLQTMASSGLRLEVVDARFFETGNQWPSRHVLGESSSSGQVSRETFSISIPFPFPCFGIGCLFAIICSIRKVYIAFSSCPKRDSISAKKQTCSLMCYSVWRLFLVAITRAALQNQLIQCFIATTTVCGSGRPCATLNCQSN